MNMTFWKTFWASLIATIVAGIVIGLVFFGILYSMIAGIEQMFEPKEFKVEDNTVLHMKLNSNIGDYSKADFNPGTFQFDQQFGVYDILEGLKIAKEDDKIKGIFIECSGVSTGFASTKEIRDGLEDFKSSGKFIVAYSDNYSTKAYYLSSVADEVYVFPSGMIQFLGLGAELMFFKGALEKLEVELQVIRGSNNKFKSFVEPFIYTEMSDENRLQTQRYVGALWDEVLTGIASSRNMKKSYLNKIADSVFIRKSGDAVKYKMADGIMYYDEVLALLEEKVGLEDDDDLELLSFKKYALKKTKKERTINKLEPKNIALIFAEGSIVDGNGGAGEIGGKSMSKMIREAREDEDIKAIVLRINSPGGSALASDQIWREVVLSKEAGKPVIVTMGNVAASGGYYIACASDHIFAQENTITGSIGVFGIIPFTGKMFENKLGITFDRVQSNEHSIISFNKKLSEQELQIVQDEVNDIYFDFISKVADGRGMTTAMVDSIGQGRVWAGTDAIEIGLVDEFGGMYDAIAYAADQASIPTDSIGIKIWPKSKNDGLMEFLEILEEMDEETTAAILESSRTEKQLMEIYHHFKSVGMERSIQARMPYMIWIE